MQMDNNSVLWRNIRMRHLIIPKEMKFNYSRSCMRHVKRYLATYTLPKKNQWDMLYTVYKVNHVNKFS